MTTLKQSTSVIVLIGPVLDSAGAAITDAVIGDFNITKNGSTAAMSGNTFSHSHNGHYLLTLTTTNVNTVGDLNVSSNNAAHAMPVWRSQVVEEAVYDSLFGASASGPLSASGIRDAIGMASADLDTQLGGLDTKLDSVATPQDVNDQVLDVLETDTFDELPSVPAATSSLKDKLTYLFMWARNKSTQTSTQRRLFADDGTTAVGTETVSDDGTTYTKGEAS